MNLLTRLRVAFGMWRMNRVVTTITVTIHDVGVSAEKATEVIERFAESRRGYIR